MGTKKWHDAHYEISAHALPILKDFMIFKSGYPKLIGIQMGDNRQLAQERWDDILKDIINAMEHVIDENWTPTDQEKVKDQCSFELFGYWFTQLWD